MCALVLEKRIGVILEADNPDQNSFWCLVGEHAIFGSRNGTKKKEKHWRSYRGKNEGKLTVEPT